MPKVYVAFTQNGSRVASGSLSELRKKVSKFTGTTWAAYQYDFKGGMDTFVLLVEGDVAKWGTPKQLEYWRVNDSNQVRKFDPTKAIVDG